MKTQLHNLSISLFQIELMHEMFARVMRFVGVMLTGNGEIETDEFMKHWMTGTGMDNKESVLVLFSIDQNDDQILQRNELDTEFGYIDTNSKYDLSVTTWC